MKKLLSLVATAILVSPTASSMLDINSNTNSSQFINIDSNLSTQNKELGSYSYSTDIIMESKILNSAYSNLEYDTGNQTWYKLNLGKVKIEDIGYMTVTADGGGYTVHDVWDWEYWNEDVWAGVAIKEPEKYFRDYLYQGELKNKESFDEAKRTSQENFYSYTNWGFATSLTQGWIKYHYFYDNNDLIIQMVSTVYAYTSLTSSTTWVKAITPKYMKVFWW